MKKQNGNVHDVSTEYFPMELKYMPVMSEQKNQSYFSLWIVNSVNTPWLRL